MGVSGSDTTEQRRVSVTELLDYMEEQIDA
jgi:hypothetical protein